MKKVSDELQRPVARDLNARSLKPQKIKPSSAKNKSATKVKDTKIILEPKQYFIEVVVPKGWPLTLAQWNRVDHVRNSQEFNKVENATVKKPTKDKTSARKDEKDKVQPIQTHQHQHQPQPGDAFVELECSLGIGTGSVARRDDLRDRKFAAARRAWDAGEPGRNLRGAQIRKEFRAEFLEALPPAPFESEPPFPEEILLEEAAGEDTNVAVSHVQQGPTPATASGLLEMSVESEEEAEYLTMPEQLKDKFIQLYFVPFCTKELIEDQSVVMTPVMAERAKRDRQSRSDAALVRMRELQAYDDTAVLERQRARGHLLEKLFVDSHWNQELSEVLEERDKAIATEALNRTLSATKKKQEAKKK